MTRRWSPRAARLGALLLAPLLLASWLAVAQTAAPVAAERELLNSERIAQRFGSYGLEVLASDARIRVSNLFSGTDEEPVGRTFAVVRYPESIDPRYAREHALILDGGSIGAVFAAHGWRVEKSHLYYGEIEATPRSRALMKDQSAARLAVHVYILDVVKDGTRAEYAVLAEVHHPDYLRLEDLAAIYGPVNGARGAELVTEMLALTSAELAASGP